MLTQPRPLVFITELTSLECDPVYGKGKSAELARRGNVRPHAHPGGFEALGELQSSRPIRQSLIEQTLQLLARRFVARSHCHVDLLVGQLPALGPCIAQPRRQGQPVLAFKLLGRLDGAAGFPLAQPYFPVQPYPAGDDVDVILVRVLVAHGHPRRRVRVKAHTPHEVDRHGFPLLGAQALAGGQ